jgi:hypothetical protein
MRMGTVRSIRPAREPAHMHEKAMENLRYIRATMERAGAFTALPGLGGAAIGATALGAAWLAARQRTGRAWLAVWLVELVLAVAIGGLATVHKARRSGVPLWTGAGRKFALGFLPPLLAGSLLTAPLFASGKLELLAALWLMLYGVGVIAAGTYSVQIVPAMGACFFALGAVALQAPAGSKDLVLGAGFGGLHLIFGFWIWRKYGG